jgi:hypothetical protein
MLEQPMIEKLLAMRLHGLVEALRRQQQDPASAELSFVERMALLVDHHQGAGEWTVEVGNQPHAELHRQIRITAKKKFAGVKDSLSVMPPGTRRLKSYFDRPLRLLTGAPSATLAYPE